jgi:hypothetical protein
LDRECGLSSMRQSSPWASLSAGRSGVKPLRTLWCDIGWLRRALRNRRNGNPPLYCHLSATYPPPATLALLYCHLIATLLPLATLAPLIRNFSAPCHSTGLDAVPRVIKTFRLFGQAGACQTKLSEFYPTSASCPSGELNRRPAAFSIAENP